MAHEIKLAGPWEFSAHDGTTWTRCKLPFAPESAEATAGERCQLRRKFHTPSRLEASSRVFVRLECDADSTEVFVNDSDAGALLVVEASSDVAAVFDVEVTSLLQQFNCLTIHTDVRSAKSVQAVRVRIVEADQ